MQVWQMVRKRRRRALSFGMALAIAWGAGTTATWLEARQGGDGPVDVELDADDLGGVVTNAGRPEAGVWVVAETQDFETRFIRIVVTDDQGRYVVPDLPPATYDVFVRGYGLVDSPRVTASLALRTASSTSRLPAVLATMSSAASIGTPDWMSVAKVRENREMATLRNSGPKTGMWRRNQCHWRWPIFVRM